ncbi:hypothetical protein [Haloarcula sp. CBA1127]|uniref:hypothetical protein n=1 Tax=Haloarcula sp. CBA1127 TaxID=1765055 RepID=UPI00073EED21|nr:hypothetical protein [Haloarcula sp. CBA1127]
MAINDRYDAISEATYGGYDQMPIGKRGHRTKLMKLHEYNLVECRDSDGSRIWACDSSLSSPLDPQVLVPW